jgi:hypothetical protein
MDDDLTIDEAVAYLRTTRNLTIPRVTLWQWCNRDRDRPIDRRVLPGARKIGNWHRGEWRIPRATLDTFTLPADGRKQRKGYGDE